MNILVIHGDNVSAAYEKFIKVKSDAKNKNWQTLSLDENTDLKVSLTTPSLFSEKRLFVLENIKKIKRTDLMWLIKNATQLTGNLLIYEKGFLPAWVSRNLSPNIKLQEFKLPKIIFTFLESFSPDSCQKSLQYLHAVKKSEPIEFTFALMAKHFKELYWVKSDSSSLPYNSWRVGKLKKQAGKFTFAKLKKIINQLAEIDIEAKTSKADLGASLELLIIKELS